MDVTAEHLFKMGTLGDFSNLPSGRLVINSKDVRPEDIFFATADFPTAVPHVVQAIRAGATAIVTTQQVIDALDSPPLRTLMLRVENPRLSLARLSSLIFPRCPPTVVAVTGTNGKSSVVSFLRQCWEAEGKKAVSLGTLGLQGIGFIPDRLSPPLTTPGSLDLHKILSYLEQEGVTHLAMEASSHGLAQYRMHAIEPQAAAFTNLTQDHLDYHGTMESYFLEKQRLFSEILPPDGVAVLHRATPYFEKLHSICKKRQQEIFSYGFHPTADLRAVNVKPEEKSLSFDLFYKNKDLGKQVFPLIGLFQLENWLCSAALALATNTPIDTVLTSLPQLQGIPGRLELVGGKNKALFFIDYAHTPDALACALKSLRLHCKKDLWVVFGCGGNRDEGKRQQMGKIAERYADRIIITDDNPRYEEAASIRRQILTGCPTAQEIPDRTKAIAEVVLRSKPSDSVLIAGKGHERSQIIKGEFLPFCDRAVLLQKLL